MEETKDVAIEENQIPKDLQDKLNSLKALSKIHKLLNEGTFHFGHMKAIEPSLIFLETLHAQVIADAASHEKADLVPELIYHKEQKAKQDGTNDTKKD